MARLTVKQLAGKRREVSKVGTVTYITTQIDAIHQAIEDKNEERRIAINKINAEFNAGIGAEIEDAITTVNTAFDADDEMEEPYPTLSDDHKNFIIGHHSVPENRSQ